MPEKPRKLGPLARQPHADLECPSSGPDALGRWWRERCLLQVGGSLGDQLPWLFGRFDALSSRAGVLLRGALSSNLPHGMSGQHDKEFPYTNHLHMVGGMFHYCDMRSVELFTSYKERCMSTLYHAVANISCAWAHPLKVCKQRLRCPGNSVICRLTSVVVLSAPGELCTEKSLL
jgi:hypothetical protein